MANHYKDVIEVLFFDNDIQYESLVAKIAAKHPKIVMDAYKELSRDRWKDEALAYRSKGEKLKAVKLWRNQTGLGIKEAKEAVEAHWANN